MPRSSRRPATRTSTQREKGLRLLAQGKRHARVAQILGVCRKTVYNWEKSAASEPWRRPPGTLGRTYRLKPKDVQRLLHTLRAGPKAYGLLEKRWTLASVADVIAQQSGCRYTLSGIWRLLKRLGWTTLDDGGS